MPNTAGICKIFFFCVMFLFTLLFTNSHDMRDNEFDKGLIQMSIPIQMQKGAQKMEDKKTETTQQEVGDANTPTEGPRPLRFWGKQKLNFMNEYDRKAKKRMKDDGTLYYYLNQIDDPADAMMEDEFPLLLKRYGVTEELKAENMMEWVGRYNNCHSMMREIIYANLINIKANGRPYYE